MFIWSIAMALSIILAPLAQLAWCATLNVGQGKRFAEIQSAIETAKPGDIIKVAPGLYTESLTIKKPITIMGSETGPEKCVVSGKAPLLRVEDVRGGLIKGLSFVVKGGGSIPAGRISNVSEKFEIQDCAFDGRGIGQIAIRFVKSSPRISNVKTHDFTQSGWEVTDNSAPMAKDCYFFDNSGNSLWFSADAKGEFFGCVLDNSSGIGIMALGESSPKIMNTLIENHASAFRVVDHARLIFENCIIANSKMPGTIGAQAELNISKMTFFNNLNGDIVAGGKSSLTISETTFKSNPTFGIKGIGRAVIKLTGVSFDSQQTGVSLNEDSVLTAKDCDFLNCKRGMLLDASSMIKHTISESRFISCEYGIRVRHYAMITCSNVAFERCRRGIEAMDESEIILQNSHFSRCIDFALKTGGNCNAELNDCDFKGDSSKVWMENSSQVTARNCTWEKISTFAIDAQHDAVFAAEKCTFNTCTHGLRFADKATGSLYLCQADTGEPWISIIQTQNVKVEKSTLKGALVGVNVASGGLFTSLRNKYEGCSKAAIHCMDDSRFNSKQDEFIKNSVAVMCNMTAGGRHSEIIDAKFSDNVKAALDAYGNSSVSIAASSFTGETHPVQTHDSAEVTLQAPIFKEISAGGLVAHDQSSLTVEKASFKNSSGGVLTALDKSTVSLKQTEFDGGKGPVLTLKGRASVDFTECKWKNLSGVAIQTGEAVAVQLVDSTFTNVEIPVMAGAESRLRLTKITIKDNKNGIVLKDNAMLKATDVRIAGCENAGIDISSKGDIHISKSAVDSRNIGIFCHGMSRPSFSGISISASNIGLLLKDTSLCEAGDISLDGCLNGIEVGDTAKLRLNRGTLVNSRNGLILKNQADAELIGLSVKKTQSGLMAGDRCRIRAESTSISATETPVTIKDSATFSVKQLAVDAEDAGIHLLGKPAIDVSDLQAKIRGSKGTCVLIEGSPTGTIDGLTTVGGSIGMSVGAKMNLVVKKIDISNARTIGLSIFGDADIIIDSASIRNCVTGASVSQTARPQIGASSFSSCDTAISCTDNSAPSIRNCTIKECKTGVSIKEKSSPVISRLQVKEGLVKGSAAVEYLNESSGKLIEPAINSNQEYGIIIRDQADPFIFGANNSGYIKGCGNGIAVLGESRPVIYNLTVEDNMQNGIFVNGASKPRLPASPYISGCRIRGHLKGAGIYLGENSKAYIMGLYRKDADNPRLTKYTQNIIRSNLVGIFLTRDAEACIDGNLIESNGRGMEIGEISQARVHRNHIRESKFIEMDKGGEGILVKDKASVIISDHNQIYGNRSAGILLNTRESLVQIENNEIYENVNLPEGSSLGKTSLGAVMISNQCKVNISNNYIHDNKAPAITIRELITGTISNNLIERNQTGGMHLIEGARCTVNNNTLVGLKHDDYGLLLGSGLQRFYCHNNILYKFSRAFDAHSRISSLPKKWAIQRNSIHNCEIENGSNLPDLLTNYKLDPIFRNPNGKGGVDFTPEPGSKICDSSPRYDWGDIKYCGAFRCKDERKEGEAIETTIISPSQDGDIVSRQLSFKAKVKIPRGEKIFSWSLFVNNNLAKQSRGIIRKRFESDQTSIIKTKISLPYGRSTLRLEVNSETGDQWSTERMVYTAKCSESHKRWVLLVGVSDYSEKGSIPNLNYAAADAMALEGLFHRRSRYAPYQDVEIIILTDERATREGLRQALFGRIAPCARADDEVIIFFAGHGIVERDRFYLALHDTDLDRLELTGYEMQELRDVILYNIKSNHILLLFDACHSGGVSIDRKPANVLNSQFAQITQSTGNLSIIAASRENEVSFEGRCRGKTKLDEQGHGYFTCALLHGMMGGAREENSRSVNLKFLVQYLNQTIPEMSDNQQHPQAFGKITKDFVMTTLAR